MDGFIAFLFYVFLFAAIILGVLVLIFKKKDLKKWLYISLGITLLTFFAYQFMPTSDSTSNDNNTESTSSSPKESSVSKKESSKKGSSKDVDSKKESNNTKTSSKESSSKKNTPVKSSAPSKTTKDQQAINNSNVWSYGELLKSDKHAGKQYAVNSATVIQADEEDGKTALLAYINDDPSHLFWIDYSHTTKAVEDSVINVKGKLGVRKDYDTQDGGSNTVPSIKARTIDVIN